MNSYIVASLGRCGSQLMTVALHNHLWGFLEHQKSFLKKTRPFIRQYPEKFKNGIVHKTHLYPTNYPSNCKVVFTFGNPMDIVMSVIKKSRDPSWGPAHYKNMAADWNRNNTILSEDVLNLEKMFDAFYQPQTCDTLCVRYETMWHNEDKISEFLGFEFNLPNKKERDATSMKKHLSKDQIKNFNTGYATIIEKINKAEDCKLWSKK